ncbi:sigma-70 family RNA polymerase sigma factor [Roseospirillum parvum]|uniref:RNA polymerase sigma factor n=1 Tax=Roseospirillum parvum TaxID=83401 RepID=A0A1G7XYD1_9PROT|nr:sigma-70 family RNA polymerase sigma factor [Roseospirillum parvum]SDG89184.1 RNA polymerase sigma-70 factor, ECF subfamily [Roseospirillum parvum]
MSQPDPAGDAGSDWSALLVAVGQRRDRAAFARLFAHFGPRLKSYLMRLGAQPNQAEDVVQEAMLMVWRKAHLFDPQRAEAATWLFTIARNRRIDLLRRDGRGGPAASLPWEDNLPDPVDETPLPDERLDQTRQAEQVRRAIATLPPEQAQVVHLSFFQEMAHGAIADHLDVPLGTVKSRLRLAMKRIRQGLGKDTFGKDTLAEETLPDPPPTGA